MPHTKQYEIVLLGATGYTGKLTAEYIATNTPTDLRWAIAGRNGAKLQAVVGQLLKLNPDRPKPEVEVCELKVEELETLVKKTRVVINTIGPFMYYGEPVLAACARNGTHYFDCTGEVPWVYEMIESYHEMAKRNKAIIIPQCGVDSVPADLLSFVLVNHVHRRLAVPTASITNTLAIAKSGFSGGTLQTALSLFSKYPLRTLSKTMSPYALSPMKPSNPTPPPSSNLFYKPFGVINIPELGGLQTNGMMAGVNTSIVHRSWGLYETIYRRDPKQHVLSYGPHFRYTEYMRAKNLFHGSFIHYMFVVGGALLAFPPTRMLLTPLLKLLLPGAGEGPSEEERRNNLLSWQAFAVPENAEKKKVMGEFTVKLGGYAATGLLLVEAAMVVLREDLYATEAGKLGGGVLTPATLGDLYVERLREAGIVLEAHQEPVVEEE